MLSIKVRNMLKKFRSYHSSKLGFPELGSVPPKRDVICLNDVRPPCYSLWDYTLTYSGLRADFFHRRASCFVENFVLSFLMLL